MEDSIQYNLTEAFISSVEQVLRHRCQASHSLGGVIIHTQFLEGRVGVRQTAQQQYIRCSSLDTAHADLLLSNCSISKLWSI